MKKIITFLLALSFCIVFSACGGSAPETSEEVMSTPVQTQNGPSSGEDVSYNDVIFNELKIKIPALCIKGKDSTENDVSYYFLNTSGESGVIMVSCSEHNYGDPASDSSSMAFSTFSFWKTLSDEEAYTISDIEKLDLQNVYGEKATFVMNDDGIREGEMYIFFTSNYKYSIIFGWEQNNQPDLMKQSIQEIMDSISFYSPSTYKAGTYKVGTEIPAGEYYLEPISDTLVSYSIYSDGAKENILDIEIFKGQCFVTVEDGQYLELDNCTGIPVNEAAFECDENDIGAGMYRVGIDIPRGEYKLYPPDNRSAYIHVYTNSTESRETIQSETIDDIKYITVDDGQYFFLFNCTAEIVKQ